jgi:hypothetical protein
MPPRIGVVAGAARAAWERASVEALRAEGCTIETIAAGAAPIPNDIDLVLAFDGPSASGAVDRGAREVWSFEFGRPEDAGKPVGFGALMRGDGHLEAALVRSIAGERAALKTGAFPTTAHSLERTAEVALLGAATWPAHVVRENARGCALRVVQVPARATGAKAPTPAERVALRLRLAARTAASRFGYLFSHEHWNIGVAQRPIESFVENGNTADVRWLPEAARGTFVADPFGCVVDDTAYVFCEGYDYRDETGYLAAGALTDGAVRLAPFLRLATHLSYPYIVHDGGAVYCIPEMSQAGEIALYRARRLPHEWERVATLVDGFGGVDPTLVRFEGHWWMFCTSARAPNHELHIFVADRIDGPWREHARRPAKVDVRSSRPAGTPFVRDGVLYRPAQDCAGGYGRRVVINRVEALTPTEFDERPAAYVAPDSRGPCPDGVHTLSAFGDRTLVDGKSHRFSPAAFASTARSYARKLAGRRPAAAR